ncbi:MAG: hypothetical protein EWV75_04230 [Microcystis wesenbergii Mw_QC_S_20081001_S30D]|uniref:Uncharacterized protein n=1 Tax=Microcystis wesenbergii Mw_QC_S_20081001_S30D TaxID=2486245 RepID=A0A552JVN3_9CHRO|nr:MAG: hypothetical protein EWV73_17200 [Microcystis wesenbergii Mw_QC_B_20070930_S4D]TRU99813.1 MAG: hypothetical protein EWV75_04230 [Microcystis wesenbergii Mw_QC_S_20081001_S30D]TRV02000.1 MAG: hypothetical protein EWV74_09790 [Microcystis wesenbergii Mw_QC_S_20081001_S30]TRV10074.1 MAG: hypothetical protein EWV89_17730 [Microcystis wesenbergii Mw_QC_B_20070930_S4]
MKYGCWGFQLSVISYQLSVISYQLSVISYQILVFKCAVLNRFFVTWYGSIGGHKSTKSLSGKRFN